MPLLLACAFFQADFQLPLEFSIVPSGVALHDHAPMRSIDSNLLQLSAKIMEDIESATKFARITSASQVSARSRRVDTV